MNQSIETRKVDHLTLCANEEVGFRGTTTCFEHVKLIHDALPDLNMASIDTSSTLFGKRLSFPLVIAAMTGGTDEARSVNRQLAELAEQRGYAFGLGSQRAMQSGRASRESYEVRDVAPSALILGNLGVIQARAMSGAQIEELIGAVGADALCVHLNPAMELVQPGGDRDFSDGLATISRLVSELKKPVIVKETGCGISASVAARLRAAGVSAVDVSGAGGTSWVGVETRRAEAQEDEAAYALGSALWDWGIPTAASVAFASNAGFDVVIATGGLTCGSDVAKAIVLGASIGGIARPILKALRQGGVSMVNALFDRIEAELRAIMLLTASRDLQQLRSRPKVISGELQLWLRQLSMAERNS